MNDSVRMEVAELLEETRQAHHAAFADSGGDDPDWPVWYAEYAQDLFEQRAGLRFTRAQLIYCLMRAEMEHQARAPDVSWANFYANEIVEHCAASESPAEDGLALYHFDGCPFCAMVRAAIADLDLDVELRNIHADADYRDDLIAARGRATVPVLRITSPNGDERWMPESRDIINYLQQTYG